MKCHLVHRCRLNKNFNRRYTMSIYMYRRILLEIPPFYGLSNIRVSSGNEPADSLAGYANKLSPLGALWFPYSGLIPLHSQFN